MADIAVDNSDTDSVAFKCSESILYCQICMERFDSPRILQCQHNFCRECVISLIQKHCVNDQGATIKHSFPCPVCRRDCKIRRKEVDDVSEHLNCFPENLLLKELLQGEVVDKDDEASDESDENVIEVIPESNFPHFDNYEYEVFTDRIFVHPCGFRNTRIAGMPIMFDASTQTDSTHMMICFKIDCTFHSLVEILMFCRLFSIPLGLNLFLAGILCWNIFIGINSLPSLIEMMILTIINLVTIVYMTQTSVLYMLINMCLLYFLVWKYFEFHRHFNHCPVLCRIGLTFVMTENCYHIWYMYCLYTDPTMSRIWFLVKLLPWDTYMELLALLLLFILNIIASLNQYFRQRNFRRQ